MKQILDLFKGSPKKDEEKTPEQKDKQVKENPVNVETRIMQVQDQIKSRKKLLEEMDK